jgi:signal transduction histidine kinase
VETIEHLWRADPNLQVVICTAFADASWDEILTRLDTRDRLLILKKPFDAIEVLQLASALTAKWNASRQLREHMEQLEQRVNERTEALVQLNEALVELNHSLQREMNERKQLEAQLVHSEKMACIGQLAAGVAHEINNPIGYITANFTALQGYTERLFDLIGAFEAAQPELPAERRAALQAQCEATDLPYLREDVPVLLRESNEGLERVRQIVQDLKDFSRIDSNQEWQMADLHRGLDSTLNIVASELRYKAEVVKNYGELPQVECLPSQLNQVFMNLLTNAAQAMGPERGTITVATGTRKGAKGDCVWVRVSDTGSGIRPEHLSKIFDPFFTTKPVGQGTGLGLALCHGIVRKHHGRIEVQSELGRGTTFTITLPVRRVVVAGEAAAEAPAV